ncbi:hypothetical protein [Nocardia salmonicida]|uniref:hypothetical protein n=1 Tax=Nocardia salmonicida TaxID=53431 RepID=UPI003410C9E1
MPAPLWAVVGPWAAEPRRWVGGARARWSGEVYGFDTPAESHRAGPWVCELLAPLPWHTLIDSIDGVSLAYPRPTTAEFGEVWELLEGLDDVHPAVCVHMGPAPNTNHWLVEISGVSVQGTVDDSVVEVLAERLPGGLGLAVRNPPWLYWDCTLP